VGAWGPRAGGGGLEGGGERPRGVGQRVEAEESEMAKPIPGRAAVAGGARTCGFAKPLRTLRA